MNDCTHPLLLVCLFFGWYLSWVLVQKESNHALISASSLPSANEFGEQAWGWFIHQKHKYPLGAQNVFLWVKQWWENTHKKKRENEIFKKLFRYLLISAFGVILEVFQSWYWAWIWEKFFPLSLEMFHYICPWGSFLKEKGMYHPNFMDL